MLDELRARGFSAEFRDDIVRYVVSWEAKPKIEVSTDDPDRFVIPMGPEVKP